MSDDKPQKPEFENDSPYHRDEEDLPRYIKVFFEYVPVKVNVITLAHSNRFGYKATAETDNGAFQGKIRPGNNMVTSDDALEDLAMAINPSGVLKESFQLALEEDTNEDDSPPQKILSLKQTKGAKGSSVATLRTGSKSTGKGQGGRGRRRDPEGQDDGANKRSRK